MQLGTDLVVADTASGEIHRLASDDGVDRLAWSPEGGYLAVLGSGRLAVYSVAAGGVEQHSDVEASPTATDVSVDGAGRAVTDASGDDGPTVGRSLPDADGHLVSPDGSHVAWWTVDGLGRHREMTIGVGSASDDGGDVVHEGLAVGGEHVAVGVDDEGVVRVAWGTLAETVEVLELGRDGLEPALTLSASD